MRRYLPFLIDDSWYALPLEVVITVVRSVALMRLPEAAPGLMGLIDYKGTALPVLDMRFRLHKSLQDIGLDQRIILAQRDEQTIAFAVDDVDSVIEVSESQLKQSAEIFPEMDSYVAAIIRCTDKKLQLCNEQTFLYFDHELLDKEGCGLMPRHADLPE
nr:chemotaxis protein CheW [uncultured Desulfuromonas sp.]